MALPKNVIYYGSEEPLPEQIELRAGPLRLLYENGDLRYVKLGNREVIRRIYVAVRDRNWGTILPALFNIEMEITADSFAITYDVSHRQGEIDFAWRGAIRGEPDGTLNFSMDGEAHSTFLRNRIGFCVLHPIRECAGAACRVFRAEGSVEESVFPRLISPHQPFMDMASISHEVETGVWAEVRFTGDLFEMEDQRNWTDASYKTYCTPLRLPYPVEIRKGTRVSQSITLKLHNEGGGSTFEEMPTDAGIHITLEKTSTPLPSIGLGMSSIGKPLTLWEANRLKALHLTHLRVDLPLSDEQFPFELERAVKDSEYLDVPLEVAVHLSGEDDDLFRFKETFSQLQPNVCQFVVFHEKEKTTSQESLDAAREFIRSFSLAPVGAGTDADFVDLNRFPPPKTGVDFISYPMNPQVHAFDNASLVETLEAQASTVESAQEIVGNIPLVISPVTLKRRFNPDATGPDPEPEPGQLPKPVDPRQMSLFGAGWTLGSIKSIAETGAVQSVTYYETTGWRGVMETETGSPLPDKFRSQPCCVFPMYGVFADVGVFSGGEVIHSRSSQPLSVESLVLKKGGKLRILLTNFTLHRQKIRIEGVQGEFRLQTLDEDSVEEMMRAPENYLHGRGETHVATEAGLEIRLPPFAIARLDGTL